MCLYEDIIDRNRHFSVKQNIRAVLLLKLIDSAVCYRVRTRHRKLDLIDPGKSEKNKNC